jgi:hypothetical protein
MNDLVLVAVDDEISRAKIPYNLRAEDLSEEHEQRRIVPGYTDQVIIYSENQAEK